MNKYLVYTISDLNELSVKCIDLLYESLALHNQNYDFYVVTNNPNYKNIKLSDNYNIIYDNISNSPYIGWLKYTNRLPDNYENYFYFDSDILCYEKLESFVKEKNISLVKENFLMSYKWFNYPFAKEEDKVKFDIVNGVNAGSFVFKNKSFLNEIFEKSKAFDIMTPNLEYQAMFEQSCFNYKCFELVLNNEYYDITSFVKLHAKQEITEQTVYHFCGWQGFMNDKYIKMENFHKKYTNLLNIKNSKDVQMIKNRDVLLQILPKNCIIAEIGVFKGEFSKKIYDIITPKELHLIDIFEGQMCSGDKDGNNIIWINLDIEYEKLKNDLQNFSNIFLHKGYSYNILNNFVNEYFDVIYIDADHNYESVKKDLELSYLKIKNNGYICGHDYGHMFPGVIQAVNEFCNGKKIFISYLTEDGCPSYCIKVNKQ